MRRMGNGGSDSTTAVAAGLHRVIRRYESGLTRAMRRAGLRCAARFPHRAVAAAFAETARTGERTRRPDRIAPHQYCFARIVRGLERGKPLRPMHCFWAKLVTQMRCPFIKWGRLVYNPVGVPQVCGWRDVVRSVSTDDTEVVARHVWTFRRRPGRRGNMIEGQAQHAVGR